MDFEVMLTQETTLLLYAISQRNAYVNLSHLTEEDTYSGPNWSSILTGVHYDKHNVTDNSFDGRGFHVFPGQYSTISSVTLIHCIQALL